MNGVVQSDSLIIPVDDQEIERSIELENDASDHAIDQNVHKVPRLVQIFVSW